MSPTRIGRDSVIFQSFLTFPREQWRECLPLCLFLLDFPLISINRVLRPAVTLENLSLTFGMVIFNNNGMLRGVFFFYVSSFAFLSWPLIPRILLTLQGSFWMSPK